jgi:hypothetical protein
MATVDVRDRGAGAGGRVELGTARVKVRAGDQLEKLLADRGVYADGEAFGLVFSLNPGVSGRKLTPGAELVLPVAQQHSGKACHDCSVLVTRDRDRKDALHAHAEALSGLAPKVAALAPARFADEAVRKRVSESVASIARSVRTIDNAARERALALDPEMIRQTAADAALTRRWLERVMSDNTRVTAAAAAPLTSFAGDLTVRTGSLDEKMGREAPERWPEIEVTVRIRGGAHEPPLRVFYATELQYFIGDETIFSQFDDLTSPRRALPEGNYRLWAGPPGHPRTSEALTDVVRLELMQRHGNPRTIELQAK